MNCSVEESPSSSRSRKLDLPGANTPAASPGSAETPTLCTRSSFLPDLRTGRRKPLRRYRAKPGGYFSLFKCRYTGLLAPAEYPSASGKGHNRVTPFACSLSMRLSYNAMPSSFIGWFPPCLFLPCETTRVKTDNLVTPYDYIRTPSTR